MQIRAEKPIDQQAIFELNVAAFPGQGEARLIDQLRDHAKLSLSLVAEHASKVVGHIAFSPVTIETNGQTIAHGIGLAPIAVDPDLQKQGIGSALILEGIRQCREKGVSFIVVLGDPAYYSRFGFMPASNYKLEDEYSGGDAFQIYMINPASLPSVGGIVKYVSEFNGLGD
ncbi:N-acetyltransferase [Planctomycetota bacterium]|nr:N-acetyltransferase [Planctomycetota bacterium]